MMITGSACTPSGKTVYCMPSKISRHPFVSSFVLFTKVVTVKTEKKVTLPV